MIKSASSMEYVPTTCTLISEEGPKESCTKLGNTEKTTCDYTCNYILESDASGSSRFTAAGAAEVNRCTEFACDDRSHCAQTCTAMSVSTVTGGDSTATGATNCVSARVMRENDSCRENCAGRQRSCNAKREEGKAVNSLTFSSQGAEVAGGIAVLIFGIIFSTISLCFSCIGLCMIRVERNSSAAVSTGP